MPISNIAKLPTLLSRGDMFGVSGPNPMNTSQQVSCVFSAFVALIVPTLLWAGEDKEAVLAKCKLKAMELYTRKEELSQDAVVRASEHVVTCMIAAGYRIDPTKSLHAMDRQPLPGASSLGDQWRLSGTERKSLRSMPHTCGSHRLT